MEKRQRVVLYGDTLVLAGLCASLATNPAIEVIPLDTSHAVEQDLLALQPDVIIFDTGSVRPQFHYEIIQQRSGLKVIGIDPDRSQVLVWSGQQLHELSLQELVSAICQPATKAEVSKAGTLENRERRGTE